MTLNKRVSGILEIFIKGEALIKLEFNITFIKEKKTNYHHIVQIYKYIFLVGDELGTLQSFFNIRLMGFL